MTQEEKQLLLQDLCTRLPYGVKVWYKYGAWYPEKFATSIRLADEKIALSHKFNKEGDWFPVEEAGEILIKSYLRPMSSMTEEEYKELFKMTGVSPNLEYFTTLFVERYYEEEPHWRYDWSFCNLKVFDWLNKKMFDYRGLIEKGLAIEASERMYN